MNDEKLKTEILDALHDFILQRPGLVFANYGDICAYRADYRQINRALHDSLYMLKAVKSRDISAQSIIDASKRAFSGRLEIEIYEGKPCISYTVGQYFPTEYRQAAAAVLAYALWQYFRECDTTGTGDGVRQQARLALTPGIYYRWFNS